MFQSPWAESKDAEIKVEVTIKMVGDILGEDVSNGLSFLLWLLVWLTPRRDSNIPADVEVRFTKVLGLQNIPTTFLLFTFSSTLTL